MKKIIKIVLNMGTLCLTSTVMFSQSTSAMLYNINTAVEKVQKEVKTFGDNLAARTTEELKTYEKTRGAQAEIEVNAVITRLRNVKNDSVQKEQNEVNKKLSEFQKQVEARLKAEEQKLLGGGN